LGEFVQTSLVGAPHGGRHVPTFADPLLGECQSESTRRANEEDSFRCRLGS